MSSSWGQGSTRASRKVAKAVLERDGYCCQLMLEGCQARATQAHHINGLQGRRRMDALDPEEMIGVCCSCHDVVTERQRRAAFDAKQAYRNQRRHLPAKPHPGD